MAVIPLRTLSIALLALVPHFCHAAPWNLRIPFYQGPALLKRSNSQDPSCPPGFLCVQQTCPSGVVCAAGETCVDFEGTLACAPAAPQWCALNPSTLEGVGCMAGMDGVCW
jgi:hypothetical protein